MYLVDTSVWTNHFRKSDARLIDALNKNLVFCHPFITGELALGSIKDRKKIIEMLSDLPSAIVAKDAEVMRMIKIHKLFDKVLGFIDTHLLASAFTRISVDIRESKFLDRRQTPQSECKNAWRGRTLVTDSYSLNSRAP